MTRWPERAQDGSTPTTHTRGPLVTDGGEDADEGADEDTGGDDTEGATPDRSNVEVTEAGGADPADPKWEKPDPDDLPEFEVRADDPMTQSGGKAAEGGESTDPTEGMPNTARAPGDSRIKREGTQGFVAALELCARLPEDVRLPEEAADLVPAAVEAELEQDVQSFAAAEFDNPSPTVDVLEFVERDGDIWLRIRLGVPDGAFDDFDPDEIRAHALAELEGIL